MTALKEEIKSILIGDNIYLGLLGSPGAEPYQTFYLRPPEKPVLPEVVFWFSPASYSQEQGKDILSSRITLNVNAWSVDNAYELIATRIIQLLHQVPQSNVGFRAILDGEPQELYDDDLNAYGKNLTFNVFYRRETK